MKVENDLQPKQLDIFTQIEPRVDSIIDLYLENLESFLRGPSEKFVPSAKEIKTLFEIKDFLEKRKEKQKIKEKIIYIGQNPLE